MECGCKSQTDCSKECQTQDWKDHKEECNSSNLPSTPKSLHQTTPEGDILTASQDAHLARSIDMQLHEFDMLPKDHPYKNMSDDDFAADIKAIAAGDSSFNRSVGAASLQFSQPHRKMAATLGSMFGPKFCNTCHKYVAVTSKCESTGMYHTDLV